MNVRPGRAHSYGRGAPSEIAAKFILPQGGPAATCRLARGSRQESLPRAFRDRIEIPTIVTEVRYDELARSIDAIAVEVERISEAQRFTARLLAERANTSVSAPVVNAATVSAASMPRREPGITTPH